MEASKKSLETYLFDLSQNNKLAKSQQFYNFIEYKEIENEKYNQIQDSI